MNRHLKQYMKPSSVQVEDFKLSVSIMSVSTAEQQIVSIVYECLFM